MFWEHKRVLWAKGVAWWAELTHCTVGNCVSSLCVCVCVVGRSAQQLRGHEFGQSKDLHCGKVPLIRQTDTHAGGLTPSVKDTHSKRHWNAYRPVHTHTHFHAKSIWFQMIFACETAFLTRSSNQESKQFGKHADAFTSTRPSDWFQVMGGVCVSLACGHQVPRQ